MSALAKRGLLRRARGPLAFPGTKPGFDPSHIAAAQTRLSAAAMGGNFVDLTTGKSGAITGSPTNSIGLIGPRIGFPGSTDLVTFSGKPTASFPNYTFGCVVAFDVVNVTNQFLISSSNGGTGVRLSIVNAGGSKLSIGINSLGGFNATQIPIAVNTPYALFGSLAWVSPNALCNAVAVNLTNGVVLSQSSSVAAGGAPGADSGTCSIGNRGSSLHAQGRIAAAMYSTEFTPISSLLQWAADPWSFWYPQS